MKGVAMFDAPDDCCDMLNRSSEDGDCLIREASECDACTAPWHPAADFHGCSNAPRGAYPEDWTAPAASARYFYRTHAECCAAIFVYETTAACPRTDHCATQSPTPAPIGCPSGNKWHRGADRYARTCTNDLDYPSAWNDPFLAREHLFDAPAQCCARAAHAGDACAVVDICAGETTAPPAAPGADPPAESPPSTPAKGRTTARPTADCGGRTKKKTCDKDPDCGWDAATSACTEAVPTVTSAKIEPGATTAPPTAPGADSPTSASAEGRTTAPPTADCGGRRRKKTCARDPACAWDASGGACAAAVPAVPLAHASTEAFAATAVAGPTAPRPTVGCGGRTKKKACAKDPACAWDVSLAACAEAVLTLPGAGTPLVSAGGEEDCDTKMYHPTSVLVRECTNDESFPAAWMTNSDTRNKYFFAAGEECCAIFYGNGPCAVVDACSSTSR